MRFILRTTLKLLLFVFVLAVPVTLVVTLFALHQSPLPLWNIGVRNVIRYAGGFVTPSLLISYLLATLLVVALVDKMKVRSVAILHIPPLLAGALLGGVLFLVGSGGQDQLPFHIDRNPVRVGVNTFVRRDAFLSAGDKILYLDGKGEPLYLYDRGDGSTTVMREVRLSRRGGGGLYLDPEKRQVVIHPSGAAAPRGKGEPIELPYAEFVEHDSVLANPLVGAYARRLRSLFLQVEEGAEHLERRQRTALLGTLFLSLLLLSVPMAYGLNDRGWRFAGLAGVLLILAILPAAYALVVSAAERFQASGRLPVFHPFLLTAAVFAFLGIVLDLVIALRGASR